MESTEKWPEQIFIVDDDDNRAENIEENLKDLSWVSKGSNRKIPHILEGISHSNPHFFEGKIEKIIINEINDLRRTAMHTLSKEGPSIAFIDFHYGRAIKKSDLNKVYQNIDDKWRKAANTDVQKGGCICASYFSPSDEPPYRVMVPSTEFPPKGILNASEAITNAQSLRGRGEEQQNKKAMEAILKCFRKWEDLKTPSNPLDSVWESTNNWFESGKSRLPPYKYEGDRPHEWLWPHDWPNDPRSGGAEDFLAALESEFGFQLPKSWATVSDFHTLYESVKGLCGNSYCGEGGDKNLKMGSVLLIAILALDGENADYEDLIADIEPSDLLGADSKFLAPQRPGVAKTTAKSLYYFLKNVFKDNPEHESPFPEPRSLTLDSGSELVELKFDLHWSARGRDSLAGKVSRKSFELHPASPDAPPSNTREALTRLWSGLLRSSEGFGSPGSIWIEESFLRITAPAKN